MFSPSLLVSGSVLSTMEIIMWNSLSSVSRLLLRWATMFVQVTPVAVTTPVMTLGTTMTHQFTSTAAPYPGRGRSVARRIPPVKARAIPNGNR